MRDPNLHSADLLARGDASDAEIRGAQEHYGPDIETEIDEGDSVESATMGEAATG